MTEPVQIALVEDNAAVLDFLRLYLARRTSRPLPRCP